MDKKQYVVTAAYELSGGFMVNLLGVVDHWTKAFRLIDECDYKKVIYEELGGGTWSEDGLPIKEFGLEDNSEKISYTETRYFKCKDPEALEVSVMFTIFES